MNHLDKIIVQDCRTIVGDLNALLRHSLRERNRCADLLTKMGINQGEQDMRVLVPTNEIVEILNQDLIGVAVPRGL